MTLPRTHIGLAALAAAVVIVTADAPAVAAPAEGTIREVGSTEVVKDSYIVVLKPGTAQVASSATSLASQYGGTVSHTYSAALRGFAVKATEAQAKKYAGNPAVAYVEPNTIVRISAAQTDVPSWGLDRVDQRDQPMNNTYNYPENTAAKVTVYVIDTGVRFSHFTFQGRARSGIDTYGNDNDASDCHGHGTHVAGTVGGKTYGMAKHVELVAVRVLGCDGQGDNAVVLAGIDWVTKDAATHGPAVANMSLGSAADPAVDAGVAGSIAAGITYSIAGGNEWGGSACDVSPARVPEAITVGATTINDNWAWFSSVGTCLDLFAPGAGITSAWVSGVSATNTLDGTSMATPHVTGAAALILEEHPTYTPKQVHDTIVGTATPGKIPDPGPGSPNLLLYTGS